jgi:hypothetical protein
MNVVIRKKATVLPTSAQIASSFLHGSSECGTLIATTD